MTTALSYSRLSVFEQCEARFDYQYVSKRVQDQPNEASAYGDRVHKVLEAYGRGNTPQGIEAEQTLAKWGSLVDRIVSRPGDKLFEHQMAVNKELQPVDWFAKDVWIRGIADVLIVNEDTAYVLDYKSGKVKENPTQLQLFAAMVMWHFPQVNTVHTSFIWLVYNQMTNAKYERRYLGALWNALKPRFEKVQDVVDLGVFKTKPGPLCPWCPAKDICPDARLKRR
jgi:RecB family exonuclease